MEPLVLHPEHERLGAELRDVDGWTVPVRYGDVSAEHAAVRGGVGVIDRSERGKLEATGSDRAAFLHGMLSNDIRALVPGQGCRSALLDVHGKVTALLAVHCLPDRLVLETERARVATVLATLDHYLFSERVELEDVSAAWGLLTVAGPVARRTIETALGIAVPALAPRQHVLVERDGMPWRVVGGAETGEAEEYDVWIPTQGLAPAWARLRQAGATPVGRAAWEILRVEAGVVRAGVDVDPGMLLLEAPLEDAYSLSKGCYLGQEVVARVTYRGHVNRRLVGIRLEGARVPPAGAPIVAEGREIGRITSAVLSPAVGRALGFGVVRHEHAAPGTRVDVRVGDDRLPAEVSALPFHATAAGTPATAR
ncbi:MAG TPA: glycine cleavage T C-terminal barrel domain-containing protein [Methylomirabilota bacterium]|nr:glycine cleavage T C-terminal barrel domain-containing protein [Methylomirabilota bacterium]